MSFNWIHYKYLNPDLLLKTQVACMEHYNIKGKNEQRKCNIYMEYPDFDYKQYALNYSDLSRFDKSFLENHWLQYGRTTKENRTYKKIDVINNIICNINNNIYPTLISFNDTSLYCKELFIYHYISLIYLNNDENSIHFEIDKSDIKDIIFIIASIENGGNILLCSYLIDIINNNDYILIINNFKYNVNGTNHSFKFKLNQYNTNYILYFIINNDSLQYISKNKNKWVLINKSNEYLFMRKINNNMNIDLDLDKNIINENNIDKIFNKPQFNTIEDDIRINFNHYENKIMYLLDRKIFSDNIMNKFINTHILKINDSFEISYKISKNCNILIITNNDWSNTAYRFMKSLEKEGINTILLKLNYHMFNYKHQGIVLKTNNTILNTLPVVIDINKIDFIIDIAYNIKNIWFHASTMITFNKIPLNTYLYNKNFIVSHGGTTYRTNPDIVGNYFNRFVNKTLIQCPDLLDLNKNNHEELIYYPVDINLIKPNFNFKDVNKIVFTHCPSTSNIKGTNLILDVIKQFENKILYKGSKINYLDSKERCTWEQQLLKYQLCDVYIETLNLSINGKPYGEWGNTCLEAAASGCIVITNCLNVDKYIKIYKNIPPILICNSKKELYNQINKVINMNRDDIKILKNDTYNWAKEYHSLEACGKKLKNFIFNN